METRLLTPPREIAEVKEAFCRDANVLSVPYPPSDFIQGISFAPVSSIIRKARGSDNWPMTWGDDDNLYTAYGDGWGFEPRLKVKLSLGFAKVVGGPEDFFGVNIRSVTGEQIGDGETGKKASGMLMIDGVLYMWVRNANKFGGHCQLAWSDNHAETWNWSRWRFEEFGYCTFLQFGRDYAKSRDRFVYMYSHDSPRAYYPSGRFILMRVPKDQIMNRGAYEFFRRLHPNGDPIWTKDIAERGAVFSHKERCMRSGISYNAPLKRYLWWQGGIEPVFRGGFGLYDAPEPWGPWTTAFYTPRWDVDPGETGSFPPKWMSADGKMLYLVFSGNDSLSVRKAVLTLSSKGIRSLYRNFGHTLPAR